MRALLVVVSLSIMGCRRPPEAPAELDELCKYMYSHMSDEEDDYLAAGVVNLSAWLDANIEQTSEGYVVQNLDQDVVNGLDGEERDVTDLVGAAVGYDSAFDVQTNANAVVLQDQGEIYPDTYTLYERTWREPEEGKKPTCFDEAECVYAEADNHSIASYPLSLEAETWSRAQYRWVESDIGLAMVHRTWMTDPAVLSLDWINLEHQFFMTITLPLEDGRARRLQATWMVASLGDAAVPEATALNMVVSSMQGTAEDLEAWLNGS